MRPKDKLIRHMIGTFERLGRDCLARIDARVWAEYYRKKARRLGIKIV